MEVIICFDFQDMGLHVKSSSELENKKNENIISQRFNTPKPLKENFTWQQKEKWPQTNNVSTSVAVNARRKQGGV